MKQENAVMRVSVLLFILQTFFQNVTMKIKMEKWK